MLYSPTTLAEPSAAEKETARSLMDEGDRLFAKGELAGALKRYRAAHQIMGVPTTGIEVARVQEKMGLLVEARAMAIEVAHSSPSAKEPKVFAEARAEATELASDLEARVPSVTIEVGPPEADATIKIGDTLVPQVAVGLPYKVNPGKHVLNVTAPGYLPQNMEFEVAEAEERVLHVVLVSDRNVAPGPEVVDPNATSEAKRSTSSGEPSDASGAQAEGTSGGGLSTHTWVVFGVAAATGLVGGGAGVYSWVLTNDAKDSCDGNACPAGVRDKIDNAKTMAWVANIGLGVAVLAAGYGVYTLFTSDTVEHSPSTAKSTRTHASWWKTGQLGVAVSPRGDSGALTWTGAF